MSNSSITTLRGKSLMEIVEEIDETLEAIEFVESRFDFEMTNEEAKLLETELEDYDKTTQGLEVGCYHKNI